MMMSSSSLYLKTPPQTYNKFIHCIAQQTHFVRGGFVVWREYAFEKMVLGVYFKCMQKIAPFLLGIFLFVLLLCPVVMIHTEHMHDRFDAVALHTQNVFELSSAIFFFLVYTFVALFFLWAYHGVFLLQKN